MIISRHALAVSGRSRWASCSRRRRYDPTWLNPQLTAFFTSATILASSAAVNFVSAKAVGHMVPSSRFAVVVEAECRVPRLELLRGLEEADDLAVLGIRGHPVPELRREVGALALMMAWSRSAMARSDSGISAIFASTSLSSSALAARAAARGRLQLLGALLHRVSFLVVNPSDVLSVAVVLLADFCVSFMAVPPCES